MGSCPPAVGAAVEVVAGRLAVETRAVALQEAGAEAPAVVWAAGCRVVPREARSWGLRIPSPNATYSGQVACLAASESRRAETGQYQNHRPCG